MVFGGINFGSDIMAMQASANIADAQMGMMQGAMAKEQLLSHMGQMPVRDVYQREKAIDLNNARLDTFEKLNVATEKATKKRKY